MAQPEAKRRRSSRQTAKRGNNNNTQETEGALTQQRTAEEGRELGSYRSRDSENESRKSVRIAMEELGNLERLLTSATKRQKLKVEESTVDFRVKSEGRAFEPGMRIRNDRRQLSRDPPGSNRATLAKENPDRELDEADDAPGQEDYILHWKPGEAVPETSQRGARRPPPVNSGYLPLPWKGRLGYACINTYLRTARPPVFCSRTCRTSSIIEHRHPLRDPSQPEHVMKNRPDMTLTADVELGQKFVQELGLANARDMIKIIRWNEKYNIKFWRLSSKMFPFASHKEHGYKLAPFAAEVLAETGKVVAELGHRVTTYPGQYTQLGSAKEEVVAASVRELEYHDEMLSLLRLPEEQNRDAVIVLQVGGIFGNKAATLDRFRENYSTRLTPSIRARLVLENDDMAWGVHDLLPLCEELDIPLVLDFHHHNIIFDSTQVREGTLDVSKPELMDRIAATWRRKNIRQKMHYSEPCPGAVTLRERRRHGPRVTTLPPCPPDVDLMIEAKDKEQAVFEIMRVFRLPGFERINDMIPHEREDEDTSPAPVLLGKVGGRKARRKKAKSKSRTRKRKSAETAQGQQRPAQEAQVQADVADDEEGAALESEDIAEEEEVEGKGTKVNSVPPEEFAMGGPQNRVYWPPGREDWLRPPRQAVKTGQLDWDDNY